MAKLTLNDVSNLSGNPTGAQTTINDNSAAIETALENTLSRDGTSPNTMGAVLDMNTNRIINLAAPSQASDAVRLTDVQSMQGGGTVNITNQFLQFDDDPIDFRITTFASASTVNIGASDTSAVQITGTTTITSFGTVPAKRRWVYFTNILTLTHNATSLILPGAANITTAAGDTALFLSDASGNWRCWSYEKSVKLEVVGPASSTDNAVVRWDGTSGNVIQNSGVTIDDSNNIYLPGSIEIGNISDTTLSRLAAGIVGIEGRAIQVEYRLEQFGAVDITGVTGNDATLIAAFNAISAAGGGTLLLPWGIIGLNEEFPWGDGTDTTPSTKYNKITLKGRGKGLGFGAGQAIGTTVIRYIGSATDNTKAVLNLKGPLHNIQIEDLEVDANAKLGYGILTNHVTDFKYTNVTVRNWRVNHYAFTTRTGFPVGAPWGCSNGILFNCYAYDPFNNSAGGFLFTSGVNPGTTLIGNPDSANIDVYGGVFLYGGSTGSYGCHFYGADNNTLYGCQLIPLGGNDGGGKSIFFTQWPASTSFPLENIGINVGISQDIGGTSGTGGNYFPAFSTGDGASVPTIANVFATTTHGKQYLADGTAALPTYTFSSDRDTGFYRFAANTIGLAAGGVLAATLDNIGNFTMTRSGGITSYFAQRSDTHGPGVVVGQYVTQGKDSAANFETYTNMYGVAIDDTSGSEDGRWTWQVVTAGILADELHLIGSALYPATNDGLALGLATNGFADLFGASGFTLNLSNSDWIATHSTGILTVGTGDLRVTTAGTNTASVVTLGGTQTLSSKTLTAPRFANAGFIADANGNEEIIFNTTALAVNEVTLTNATTGTNPSLSATGGDINIGLSLTGKGTGGVILGGTSTNDDATAGKVGELISSNVAKGLAVPLTTNTAANVTSISLTAGDWDVHASVWFDATGTTSISRFGGDISTTSATLSTFPNGGAGFMFWNQALVIGDVDHGWQIGTKRISLSSTTTVYLVAIATFTVDTLAAFGFIGARRVR